METSARKHRVLVSDKIDSTGIRILDKNSIVDVRLNLTEEEICNIISKYDALMVRSGTQVTEKIIKRGKNLKIIGRAGVGVDNVHIPSATDMGVYVVNSPSGNTVAAAEHTLALMLAVSRNISTADRSIRSLKWERSKFMGTQLQHKTLGIIGIGQVGSHVAKVAGEFGMNIIAFDPFSNESKVKALGGRLCTLEELYAQSDFITLHVPLNDDTRNLICKKSISLMKPTARIINVARGGIINEQDLCDALNDDRLAAAALDVFEDESAFSEDSPLLKAKNLLITPHLGASTFEAQQNVATDVAEQINAVLEGKLPDSAVNIPGMKVAELAKIKAEIDCCACLGRTAMQLLSGAVETISLTLEGSAFCQHRSEPLLLAVSQGVIGTYKPDRVNFVNVKSIVEEQRINLKVSKESFHLKNAFRVQLYSDKDLVVVKGTVTEEKQVLLTLFKGIPIYMIMPNVTEKNPVYMFYSMHRDQPGSLASITSLLHKNNVNIAFCHLGRKEQENGNNIGVCVFHVDSIINDDVLRMINALEDVIECKLCFPSTTPKYKSGELTP